MKLRPGVFVSLFVCAGVLLAIALWPRGEPRVGPVHAPRLAFDDGLDDGDGSDRSIADFAAALDTDAPASVLETPALEESVPQRARADASARAADTAVRPSAPGDGLRAGASRVSGAVRGVDGKAVAGAHVALFALPTGDPESKPDSEVDCAADGSFSVVSKTSGDCVLAAYAPGMRPTTIGLSLAAGSTRELDPIEIDPGVRVDGSVSTDGDPQGDAELVAILDSRGPTVKTADATFRWTHGRFEWSFVTARNAADGRFRIVGLRPGPYHVRIAAMRGPNAVFGFRTLESMEVDAPNEGTDFKLTSSSLELDFECDRAPVPGVVVELETQGVQVGRTADESGHCRLRALPSLDCSLIVRKPGYLSRLIPVQTPPVGITRPETIELRRAFPPAALRFDIVSSDGEPIDHARFAFFRTSGDTSQPFFHTSIRRVAVDDSTADAVAIDRAGVAAPRDRRPDPAADDPEARKVFLVTQLQRGTYRMVVQAGPCVADVGTPSLACTTYCDIDVSISVPETGVVERTLTATPRACLDVSARNANGEFVPAHFKLLARDGSEVDSIRHDDPTTQRRKIELCVLSDERASRVYAATCSGSMTLELSQPGYRTLRVPVDLVPGVVSWVDVTLTAD